MNNLGKIQGYNSSLTMLGGPNNNQISQNQPDENNSQLQNDLDDDIPF